MSPSPRQVRLSPLGSVLGVGLISAIFAASPPTGPAPRGLDRPSISKQAIPEKHPSAADYALAVLRPIEAFLTVGSGPTRTVSASEAKANSAQPAPPAPEGSAHQKRGTVDASSGLPLAICAAVNRVSTAAGRASYKLRFLTAFVPDPLDSQLGASFDQAVSAILRGASSDGWLRDRHWLPWESDAAVQASARGKDADGKAVAGTDPAMLSLDPTRAGRIHLSAPGVLLLKRTQPHELLVVFLVGESHIHGVEAEPFRLALKLTALFAKVQPDTPNLASRPIQILGPQFSGTAASVRLVLRDLCGATHPPTLRSMVFVSGSATSSKVQTILASAAEKACQIEEVRFKSTVVPDEVALKAAFGYFTTQLNWHTDEIALITEADSLYGLGNTQEGGTARWSLLVPIPSGSADVRSALEHDRSLAVNSPAAQAVSLPRLALDLPLQQTREPADAMRASSALSAPLNEANINHLASAIAHEHVRHVGLFLTDVRDTLFLAERLKTYAHSVSLFTFQSNLLYTHPRAHSFLKGMIVISSYPLDATLQSWFAPASPTEPGRSLDGSKPAEGIRVQFSSDLEEGLFNATVLQLAPADHLDTSDAPLIDYLPRLGRAGRAPAIWLSALGADRLVPLVAISDYDWDWKPSGGIESVLATIRSSTPVRSSLTAELDGFIGRLRAPGPFKYFAYLATILTILLYVNCLAGSGPGLLAQLRRRFLRTNPVLRPLIRRSPRERLQWYVFMTIFVLVTTGFWNALSSIYLYPFALRRAFNPSFEHGSPLPFPFQRWEEKSMAFALNILVLLAIFEILVVVLVVWRLGTGLSSAEDENGVSEEQEAIDPSSQPPDHNAEAIVARPRDNLHERRLLIRLTLSFAAGLVTVL